MKGNYLEAEKLIDCLKAVINQQKIPANDILMNWELFLKQQIFIMFPTWFTTRSWG